MRQTDGYGQASSDQFNTVDQENLEKWQNQSYVTRLRTNRPPRLCGDVRRALFEGSRELQIRIAAEPARQSYYDARPRGSDGDQDNPLEAIPYDGQYSIVRRWNNSDTDWGVVVRYIEGRGDRAWMEKRDRNYERRTQPQQRAPVAAPALFPNRDAARQETNSDLIKFRWCIAILSVAVAILGAAVVYLLFPTLDSSSSSNTPPRFGR